MPLIPVQVTDEEQAAVAWMAAKKGITPSALLTSVIRPELTSLVRVFRDRRWEVRRKAIEADPALAAPVDAAAEAP